MASPVDEAAAPAQPSQRERELWPYVQKLRDWCEISEELRPRVEAAEIRIGPNALVVQPWERAQVARVLAPDHQEIPRHARLTAQGVALLTKCLHDMEQIRFSGHGAIDVFAVQADLMLDIAIGESLARELQEEVERSVVSGGVEQAKLLTEFRNKMLRGVALTRQRIAEAERGLAELRAAVRLDERADLEALSLAIDRRAAERPAPDFDSEALGELDPAQELRLAHERERNARLEAERRRLERLRAALPTRSGTLFIAFALALAAWGGIALPPLLEQPRLVPIGRDALQFRTAERIASVTAFPPSLYLEVEAETWEGMSEIERLTMIEEVGHVCTTHGYSGALLRDPRGRPLAQWLRTRGARLIRRDELPAP